MSKLFQQLIMGYADHPFRIRYILFFFVLGSHAESIQNAIQYDGCTCDTEGWDLSSIAQAAIVSSALLSLPAGTAVLQADPQVVS